MTHACNRVKWNVSFIQKWPQEILQWHCHSTWHRQFFNSVVRHNLCIYVEKCHAVWTNEWKKKYVFSALCLWETRVGDAYCLMPICAEGYVPWPRHEEREQFWEQKKKRSRNFSFVAGAIFLCSNTATKLTISHAHFLLSPHFPLSLTLSLSLSLSFSLSLSLSLSVIFPALDSCY